MNSRDNEKLKEDLIARLKKLLNNLGDGDISPSAYDTAWVARIPDKNDPTKPMFPQCLKWVQDNQLEDGSWGSPDIEYYHDRIICTLSCIVALKVWNISSEKITKGEDYIHNNLTNLKNEKFATVGFELIFPNLVNIAQNLEIDLPLDSEIINHYRDLQIKKLNKIPIKSLYELKTTIGHSLEFLNPKDIDFTRLKFQQLENGSYGCSPASSAFVIMNCEDNEAEKYIINLLERFENYMPALYPIDIFERAWVVDSIINLDLQNYFTSELDKHVQYFNRLWNNNGLGFSKFFPVIDIDDTNVVLRILNKFKLHKDLKVFENFRSGKGFFCYIGELDSSPTHISNLITALIESENDANKEFYLDIAFKSFFETFDLNYRDKWHISPYYTFSRLNYLLSMKKFDKYKESIYHLIYQSQNDDGGWGIQNISTVEETAYALVTFIRKENKSQEDIKVIKNGFSFMIENMNKDNPYLWIGKSLYKSLIVEASIFSVIIYILDHFDLINS